MTDQQPAITQFFRDYQVAIESADVTKLALIYADTFLFGGAAGTQPVRKADFLQIIPKRQSFFASVGLKNTTVASVEVTTISDHYVMAKVTWRMKYHKDGSEPVEDETLATYILYKKADGYEVVLQIDHQDLMARVKELGLI